MKKSLVLLCLGFLSLVSCQKEVANSPIPSYTSIKEQPKSKEFKKIVWREEKTDEDGRVKNSIAIDSSFFKTINDRDKACLGYVVTFVGNECWWDGDQTTDSRDNLKCVLLDALQLGYQCSDTHLDFLRKWFESDARVSKELEDCPTIPFTSTIQNTFREIEFYAEDTFVYIRTKESEVEMRNDYYEEYEKHYEFELKNEQLYLTRVTKK